jgi:hypothetical protein
MQSIRLCLGESGKLSEETKSTLEKIRDSFMEMSKLPVQFGDLKVEGIFYSFNFSNESGRTYLECEFTSVEEGA